MYRYEIEENKRKRDEFLNQLRHPNDAPCLDGHYPTEKHFMSLMGSMSHTYGNALAFIQKWVLDLFPKDMFNTVHVNSRISHRQLRGVTNGDILKKNKPMIIFRPRIGGYDEDRFLKGTSFIDRQTDLYSTYGATNLQEFLEDPAKDMAIKFQMNRSIMYVDVVIILSTLLNQIDYVHYIQNACRFNTPFFLATNLESYLPSKMLQIISNVTGVPYMDETGSTKTMLKYLNQHSKYPITYKMQGSTNSEEFYRYYPVNIETTVSDLSWDEGEKIGHVMNQYQMSFNIKMEFNSTGFYYIYSDKIFKTELPIIDAESDRVIPVYTDVISMEDINLVDGWQLHDRVSCRLEKEDDFISIENRLEESIKTCIKYHMSKNAPLIEFLDIRVKRQGELLTEGIDYFIDYNNMQINFKNQSTYYTYAIYTYINVEYVNNFIKNLLNLK